MHTMKMPHLFFHLFCVCTIAGCTALTAKPDRQVALNLLNLGNAPAAIDTATIVVNTNPKDADSYLLRAVIYDFANDASKSKKDCESALSLAPNNSRALVISGLVNLNADLSGAHSALNYFDRAASSDQKSVWPLLGKVIAKYKLGDTAGATVDVQKAVNLGYNTDLAFNILSHELQLLGFREQSKAFDKQDKASSKVKLDALVGFVQKPNRQAPPLPPTLDDDFIVAMLTAQRLHQLESAHYSDPVRASSLEVEKAQRQAEEQQRRAQEELDNIQRENQESSRQSEAKRAAEQQAAIEQGASQLQEEIRQKQSQ